MDTLKITVINRKTGKIEKSLNHPKIPEYTEMMGNNIPHSIAVVSDYLYYAVIEEAKLLKFKLK